MASQKRNVRLSDALVGHKGVTALLPGDDCGTLRTSASTTLMAPTRCLRYPAVSFVLGPSTVVHAEQVLCPVNRDVPSPMTGLTQ